MNYRIQYEKELNPSQLEAVINTDGPLLVIAGAGSGKTRTLTYRVARLVEEGISPAAILLLTFTRKASREMLQRATRVLDRRCRWHLSFFCKQNASQIWFTGRHQAGLQHPGPIGCGGIDQYFTQGVGHFHQAALIPAQGYPGQYLQSCGQ